MSILYFLESVRNPVLDVLFSIITLCGEETVFMAIGLIVMWCVDKRQGYYLLCTAFLGTILNQFLKMIFRVPRPWLRDPSFTIVESARKAATGYSFPSGHTQTAVGLFGGIARWKSHRRLRVVMILICVLVPLSRLYLGVHTPADVGVSAVLALLLVFGGYPLFSCDTHASKRMYTILLSLSAITVIYLCFLYLYSFPAEVYQEENIHNLLSAQKNGFTLLGCILGMVVVYAVDSTRIRFETRAAWWAQIIKAVVGIGLVFAVKELLRAPLNLLLDENTWARTVRYFILVIFAGILWPLTFRYFVKTAKKKPTAP